MGVNISDNIIGALRCPCCDSAMLLNDSGKSLVCSAPRRHCFDIASSGYVNLAVGHSGGGDSKQAVRSRADFLSSGAYAPISDALCELLQKYLTDGAFVIDAGCGEGYYSCRAALSGFSVLGVDLSRDAVMQASKRGRREGAENSFFAVASVYDIPVKSGCADALINIFAPCAEEEYARVLRNGGLLYVVYAGEEHLMGLKRALYDDVYRNDVRADMPERMELVEERRVRFDITLTSSELIEELFTMTPYYWRTSPEDKQKIWGLSQLSCEVDVIIAIYRKSEEKT